MIQSIVNIALVVKDYDEAIDFYTNKLHFDLIEDTYQPEQDKRWVVVAPPGSNGTTILLAKASKPEQEDFIGNQTGGRVFLFLGTDDFWRDYNDMTAKGIEFVREPSEQEYGTVAVFRDLYGNLWDLIEFNKNHSRFKEMRRDKRQISDIEVKDILIKSEYGTLATVCEDGYPYSTPLSYVYHNDAIYFHCAKEGQKLTNISNNSKVSFSVVGETEVLPSQFSTKYESVILFGNAKVIEGEEKETVLVKIIEKYSQGFIPEGKEYISKAKGATIVVKIDIDHVTGKARR